MADSGGTPETTRERFDKWVNATMELEYEPHRDAARAFMALADAEAATARAEGWDEGAEATADWMANNPSPAGIPQDPPMNPYRVAD